MYIFLGMNRYSLSPFDYDIYDQEYFMFVIEWCKGLALGHVTQCT